MIELPAQHLGTADHPMQTRLAEQDPQAWRIRPGKDRLPREPIRDEFGDLSFQ